MSKQKKELTDWTQRIPAPVRDIWEKHLQGKTPSLEDVPRLMKHIVMLEDRLNSLIASEMANQIVYVGEGCDVCKSPMSYIYQIGKTESTAGPVRTFKCMKCNAVWSETEVQVITRQYSEALGYENEGGMKLRYATVKPPPVSEPEEE